MDRSPCGDSIYCKLFFTLGNYSIEKHRGNGVEGGGNQFRKSRLAGYCIISALYHFQFYSTYMGQTDQSRRGGIAGWLGCAQLLYSLCMPHWMSRKANRVIPSTCCGSDNACCRIVSWYENSPDEKEEQLSRERVELNFWFTYAFIRLS